VRGESVFSQILTTSSRPKQGENAEVNPDKWNFEKKVLKTRKPYLIAQVCFEKK
jgi:hypothetical protein